MPEIREDLDGLRVRMPGRNSVYVIDRGRKRGIPSPPVYDELFRTWDNIHLDLDLNDIETGDPIPENACLFRCLDDPKVFLLDEKDGKPIKRHVANPAVMERFQFAWGRVHRFNVPLDVLNIADGPEITATGRPD